MQKIGVVIIGRNEGDRLRRCLESVAQQADHVIYVDSGSTDGSVDMARSMGTEVVLLDTAVPFTAARARNAGFERLMAVNDDVSFVQFIDGDCELNEEWLTRAATEMERHGSIAAVAGRLRERHPVKSIYNRLCDMEWNAPTGETRSCGGICMIRASEFKAVGGFNSALIAGEEPELCVRLRARGGLIWRVEADMGWHDAAMFRFAQWWKRSVRAGHAYTEGAVMHGHFPEYHNVRQVRSFLLWGFMLPMLILISVIASITGQPWAATASLILTCSYILLMYRIYAGCRRKEVTTRDSMLYAFFCMLAKFPECMGFLKYWLNRLHGKRTALIEYK